MQKLSIICIFLFFATGAQAELSSHVAVVQSLANRVSSFGTESVRFGSQVADEHQAEMFRNLGDKAFELEDNLYDVIEDLQVNRNLTSAKNTLHGLSSEVSNLGYNVRNLWENQFNLIRRLAEYVDESYRRAKTTFDRPEPPPWNREYQFTARRYTHGESYEQVASQQTNTLARDHQQCEATGARFTQTSGVISCEQKTVCVRGLFRCREWRQVYDCVAEGTSICSWR